MKADGWDVVVVGAGAAGLLAAGRAAMLGARVLLLEKMEKPGRKLRISGKGRANVTNAKPLADHLQEIHPEPRFLREAFAAFFNEDLVALLEAQGVPTKTERGGRVFPVSDRAWDVAEALVAWAKAQGAELHGKTRVLGLEVAEGAFAGLTVAPGGGAPRRIQARACVLATGGRSYPGTGSTGDGLGFAEATGHRLVAQRPALVSVHTQPVPPGPGLTLRNVELTLWVDGRKQAQEFGEAEATAQGLGGAAVLRLSRRIVDALAAGRQVELALDLKPSLDPAKLEARLLRQTQAGGTCRDLLRALLPGPLVEPAGEALGLDLAAPAARLQAPARRQLAALLKDRRYRVTGHGGWEEAIITAGGVSLKDVDPRTLGSRKVAGLHFAGELLDLDANTGGYNLQIAFSTGWLAGESAARGALASAGTGA